MIEVERKFRTDSAKFTQLLNSASFIRDVVNRDVLYDSVDFPLIRSGIILRERNGTMELKVKRHFAGQCSVHEEISGLDAVFNYLNISSMSTYVPIATFVTKRKKFLLDGFTIDVDHVTAKEGEFIYDVMEIEKIVDDPDDVEYADEAISNLAKKYQLIRTNGKLVEYFSRYHQNVCFGNKPV